MKLEFLGINCAQSDLNFWSSLGLALQTDSFGTGRSWGFVFVSDFAQNFFTTFMSTLELDWGNMAENRGRGWVKEFRT